MPTVTLAVPVAEMPALVRKAVEAVPHATLIDVDDEYALVGVRTNLPIRAETTRFDFAAADDATTTVHAKSTNMAVLGWIGPARDDIILSTGRGVFDELVRLAGER